jgi:hypothetical protein
MLFRKIILISGLVLFVLSGCNNQNNGKLSTDVVTNPNTANGDKKDNLPQITFEKDLHDFGKVIQGEKVSYSFKFKNTGNSDLVISQVHSSCGCTVMKFPKDAIKPGGSDKVTVTFDSQGRKGIQNKAVTVVSNCQPPTSIIRIKASIVAL